SIETIVGHSYTCQRRRLLFSHSVPMAIRSFAPWQPATEEPEVDIRLVVRSLFLADLGIAYIRMGQCTRLADSECTDIGCCPLPQIPADPGSSTFQSSDHSSAPG